MRTIAAGKQAVIDGGLKAYHLKVEIKDGGGTWRDLSTYPGFDAVVGMELDETLDAGMATASFELLRELDRLSISPLMDSGPNRGFNPAGSLAYLVQVNREIRASVAVVPGDSTPVSGDFELLFHGKVDSFDISGPTMKLECRDLACSIADVVAEKERAYCLAAVSGVPVGIRVWTPGEAWVLNEYVMPTEANRYISGAGRFYKVTTAGTAGTTEPTWPTSSTVNDGTAVLTYQGVLTPTTGYAVEAVMQSILNDNGLSSFTLSTPTSPSWNILPFAPGRISVWEMLRNLALQIGWDLRWKWDNGSSSFKLTFYDPNRSKTTPDATFDSDDYESLDEAGVDKQDIRNVVRVVYGDGADLDAQSNPTRKVLEVSDSNSITKYGRLFVEFSEDESSNIDSSSEATALANAALADLKEPTLSHQSSLAFGFPWAQLNDLYRFKANGRHYSSDQDLACVSIRHSFADGVMTTTLGCRGKPTAGLGIWNNVLVFPRRPSDIHAVGIVGTLDGVTSSNVPIPGGARFSISGDSLQNPIYIENELHISPTSGFTPSASTLFHRGPETEIEVSKLNPGATYYAKFIPWYRNSTRYVRGQPSAEITFTAGRAVTAHLPSEVQYWRQPLNGNLDNRFEGDGRKDELPDHWVLTAGTLGTQVVSKYDDTAGVGNAVSGKYYIRFATTVATGGIECRPMIVEGGHRYRVTALSKNISGTGNWTIKVKWLKYDQTSLSDESFTQSVTSDVGTWVDRTVYAEAPANARYAKIEVRTATDGTQSFDLDSVRFDEVPEIARYFHYPAFGVGTSVATATNTLINFNTAFDSQTNANVTTGASWKYTAPRTGYYLVQTAITIVFGNNDSGTCYVEVWKNGSAHRRMTRQSGHVLREETQYMASCMLYLTKGDYIHINIYQTTGNSRSLEAGEQTYVEIMEIG